MIWAEGITKSFGETRALVEVALSVERGRVLGRLGPNGSGKTTLVRILTTLLRADAGSARVAGFDVVGEAARLRSQIGLAGQYAAVDELLTGRENLELVGLWYHLPKAEYRRRALEMLERLSLTEAANRRVGGYSGGMRRRLDIGASLIARPPVLFLDEPTTGLDPQTRNALWDFIEELVADGTTVLLTTQYMEEAERLTNSLVVLDVGRVIAQGTAWELKGRIGGDVLEVRVTQPADLERARAIVAEVAGTEPRIDVDRRLVSVPASGGTHLLITVGSRFEQEQLPLDDLGIRHPSLDDVFLSLTGTAPSDGS
jgi:ABC-2 type transport system ATP-binding protein